jgi:hypothetical protein
MSGLELVLGVDPGKSGALAFLDSDGRLIDVVDMPDAKGAALGALVRVALEDHAPHRVISAWVEEVHAMPRQGVSSTFTFGAGYGAVLGALGALGVPTHGVTPAAWKRGQRVTADKASSRQRAVELWPEAAGRFARVRDDGRAEAALIARHGIMAGALR